VTGPTIDENFTASNQSCLHRSFRKEERTMKKLKFSEEQIA